MSAVKEHYADQIERGMRPHREMNPVIAARQFNAAIFQHKMEQGEIETHVKRLEAKFRKAEKIGNVEGTFEIQDELGVMYKRLMKMWRIKHGR